MGLFVGRVLDAMDGVRVQREDLARRGDGPLAFAERAVGVGLIGDVDLRIAVRAARKPPDESLAKRLCEFRFAPYATPEYLASKAGRELADHDWVALTGAIDWMVPAVWKTRALADERVVMHSNSVTAVIAAARAGAGVAAMPCYRGDAEAGLVRAGPTFPHLDMAPWIITHPVLRHTARVRTLMAFLTEALAQHADSFEGNSA